MSLLGVDVGTTHCKAASFGEDGSQLGLSRRLTPTERTAEGFPYYDPQRLWNEVALAIREAAGGTAETVRAVGVASMAEAGLLVDAGSGEPRSHIIPWYDSRSAEQAARIAAEDAPPALFRRSGLQPSFKYGLSKILWLRDREPGIVDGAVWLSVADYIVFRLTGRMATDPSLAARTYVFDIALGSWDGAWTAHFGLGNLAFPDVLPAGEPAGTVAADASERTGLPRDAVAAVAGHDHVAALLAAGIVAPGTVLDSLGTAESLLGLVPRLSLGRRELESGLSLVPHVLPGRFCWLGGLRSAGGSIEWLRARLADEPLSYEEGMTLAREAGEEPTGILYFPYLAGSGGICPDEHVRGAFVGVSTAHGRAHLMKAVLEGTAYEAETIRRAAQELTGSTIDRVIAVGGGARNGPWMQVKADITGCRLDLPEIPEATACGAALAAGLRGGVLGMEDTVTIAGRYRARGEAVLPDAGRHAAYRTLFEFGYEPLGHDLRRAGRRLAGVEDGDRRPVGGRIR